MSVILAGKSRFDLSRSMSVDLTSTGETISPESMGVTLGPLSAISYKPAKMRFNLLPDAAITGAVVELKLYADQTVVKSESVNLSGLSEYGNSVDISLAGITGDQILTFAVNVTGAEAGRSLAVDACVDVEVPVVVRV